MKSGLERGPRREFFFFRKVFDRGLWPPSPRSRPRAAETSMESLGPSFGPFLCFPFPFLSFLALSAFLGSPCLPPLPCSPFSPSSVVVVVASPSFAQSPSSQSPPHRALLAEPSSQSISHRALLTEPSSKEPSAQCISHRTALAGPSSQKSLPHRALLTEPSS